MTIMRVLHSSPILHDHTPLPLVCRLVYVAHTIARFVLRDFQPTATYTDLHVGWRMPVTEHLYDTIDTAIVVS